MTLSRTSQHRNNNNKTRTDGNQPHRKDRFTDGLPRVFPERVKLRIKEKFDGVITYEALNVLEKLLII